MATLSTTNSCLEDVRTCKDTAKDSLKALLCQKLNLWSRSGPDVPCINGSLFLGFLVVWMVGLAQIAGDIDANDILPGTRSSIFEWKIPLVKWEPPHMLSHPMSSQRLYCKNEYSMLMLCHLAPLQQEECLSPYHCFMDFCKHFYASHGYSHFLHHVRGLLLFPFFSVCFTFFF